MILNLRDGRQIEHYAFSLTDMIKWGYNELRNVGGPVGQAAMQGIPALHRAARIRAEALASLQLRCWRGEGPTKERVENAWQSKLFTDAANEWQTRFDFWEAVGESLAYRNNAYIWKNVDPVYLRVVEWFALHPDQVECKGNGRYKVKVRDGYVDPVGRGKGEYEKDYETILHIRGHGGGGTWEAPSPVKLNKAVIEAAIARQEHERRMWRRGTALQVAVVFPQGISKEQADEWRPAWEAAYEGTGGATTAMLGGGADIKPIGMTASDASFVEMAHLTVEDASRIMGVPANLLGAATMTGQQRANFEEDLASWFRFGIGPELERIESALKADDELFPPTGRTIYPAFDTEGFVRGDVATEDAIWHARIQDGRATPDEWRATVGLPPHPGGVGKIPQITPVGGGDNTLPVKPTEKPEPTLNVRSQNGSS